MVEIKTVSPAELAVQNEYTQRIKLLLSQVKKAQPLAMVHTYGCQQNVSDSEHIKGMLAQMGYG
ncbi:MAG: tRNA (N6-isopentenyl adenosine(37)-C2)-methylthiotransferase MiaB, partial [Ruminococcaceae bacterium]|nr:tRNA (N6-isopentenyl adenosine(37)-C2)-methylthiotransferase MiaB [Oscillospiraceae bacterium]